MSAYISVFKERTINNFKSFGASIRTILAARKKLPKNKEVVYTIILALPLISTIFINSPVIALTWIFSMLIFFPIIEAYAYAVVYGG